MFKWKSMLMIKNSVHVVFFPHDALGYARAFRDKHPEFKRRRIQKVVQALPNIVRYGKIMDRTS